MKETWRWYGPLDKIDLAEIRQTGAEGIVTALHEIPYGQVWKRQGISERNNKIKAAGFKWYNLPECRVVQEDTPAITIDSVKGKRVCYKLALTRDGAK